MILLRTLLLISHRSVSNALQEPVSLRMEFVAHLVFAKPVVSVAIEAQSEWWMLSRAKGKEPAVYGMHSVTYLTPPGPCLELDKELILLVAHTNSTTSINIASHLLAIAISRIQKPPWRTCWSRAAKVSSRFVKSDNPTCFVCLNILSWITDHAVSSLAEMQSSNSRAACNPINTGS